MKARTIEQLIELAKAHPTTTVHRGASDAELKLALRFLRVKLPRNYLVFVQTIGWVDINGDLIFGLGADVTKAESVDERNCIAHVDQMVRSTCIVIAEDGMGNYDCLDVTRIKGDDCPVVFWDTSREDAEFHKPPLVARSFLNYFARKLREAPTL